MDLFQATRGFVSRRPILSALLSFIGLFVAFAIFMVIIKATSDAETADKLAWDAAMAFGWSFWLLIFGFIIYAAVRMARWLFGKVTGGGGAR